MVERGVPKEGTPFLFITGFIACVFFRKKGRLGKLEGKFTNMGIIWKIIILSISPIVFIVLLIGAERCKWVAQPQDLPRVEFWEYWLV